MKTPARTTLNAPSVRNLSQGAWIATWIAILAIWIAILATRIEIRDRNPDCNQDYKDPLLEFRVI
jgi:hypothetical protein